MQKPRKKLVGLACLALVALMTIFAYFLPSADAFAANAVTETIRVMVYNQYPVVTITSPESGAVDTTSEINVNFHYENAHHVEFVLSYKDRDGNTQEIATIPAFNPDDLDSTFYYATGDGEITFNLADYINGDLTPKRSPLFAPRPGTTVSAANKPYNHYTLNAKSVSAVGFDGDSVDFYYVPVVVTQTGSEDGTNDPVVTVKYDSGVAKIELVVTDKNGKPIYTEPIVIEVPEPFDAGTQTITLPLTGFGVKTGEYNVVATAYALTDTGEVDDDDEPIYDYESVWSPYDTFKLNYTQPAAPDVPDTGGFLKKLNIAKTDYLITGIIAFAGAVIVALAVLKNKKKDYRKNLRNRR